VEKYLQKHENRMLKKAIAEFQTKHWASSLFRLCSRPSNRTVLPEMERNEMRRVGGEIYLHLLYYSLHNLSINLVIKTKGINIVIDSAELGFIREYFWLKMYICLDITSCAKFIRKIELK